MQRRYGFTGILLAATLLAGAASAECTGSNGRGWASGKGNGAFEMTSADGTCRISFPGFIDSANRRTPATEVTLTRAPKSGKLGIARGQGLVYTPNAGFKGKDQFCTRNTTPEVPGKTLSGCITVTVR